MMKYRYYSNVLQQRGAASEVVTALLRSEIQEKGFFKSKKNAMDFLKTLNGYLVESGRVSTQKRTRQEMIEREEGFALEYSLERDGQPDIRQVESSLLEGVVESKEFRNLIALHRQIEEVGHPPYILSYPEQEDTQVRSPEELIAHVLNQGKKGATITRFKGLGEMNPDQLWETTMNPDRRTLLQVRLEDAVAADEIFTILMGDQVDPRRVFIQKFAQEVKNLDI